MISSILLLLISSNSWTSWTPCPKEKRPCFLDKSWMSRQVLVVSCPGLAEACTPSFCPWEIWWAAAVCDWHWLRGWSFTSMHLWTCEEPHSTGEGGGHIVTFHLDWWSRSWNQYIHAWTPTVRLMLSLDLEKYGFYFHPYSVQPRNMGPLVICIGDYSLLPTIAMMIISHGMEAS